MRRREFIGLLGGATAWPMMARAQQRSKVWRVGMLDTTPKDLNSRNLAGLYKGLSNLGYVEGQNLLFHYLSSDGRNEEISRLTSELINFRPDAIVVRGTPQLLTIMRMTSGVPIVMAAIADPIGSGVISELARPGGNVTGLISFATELEAKRVELLTEMLPGIRRIGTIRDFSNPTTKIQWELLLAAAQALNIEVERIDVRAVDDLKRAFAAADQRLQALVIGIDTVTSTNRRLIVELAKLYRLPAIYPAREFVDSGGMISYGVSYPDLYFRTASYLDRIFNGARPADLPVEQPTKLELIINVKTTNALGLRVPPSVLARADEVIE